MSAVRTTTPFVGREEVIETLLRALDDVRHPEPRVVIVRGEAGIGKSRLVKELGAAVTSRGVRMLYGRAERLERALPYSAIGNALEPLLDETTEVGELARVALQALSADGSDPSDRVLRVFRGARSLFEALGEQGAFVFVLDDLHNADDDTIALLLSLVRRSHRLPALFVVTLREPSERVSDAVHDFMVRVEDDSRSTSLALRPLATPEVIELIEGLVGNRASFDLADDLISRTGGNPLLLRELVASVAVQGGDLGDMDMKLGMRLSDGRGSMLLGRFLPLGPETRRFANALALLTDPTVADLPTVAVATGFSVEQVDALFDDLVRAGLLQTDADGAFGFSHELIREALALELGPVDQRRLHGGIAGALEASGSDDVVAIAHHAAAAAVGADERAAALAIRAGDRMLAAPNSAAEWYGRAVTLAPERSTVRGQAHGRRAQALARGGRLVQASEEGRLALALLPEGEERDITLGVLVQALIAGGTVEDALDLLDVELRSHESPRLRVWRASALALLERWPEAEADVEAAQSLGPRHIADRMLVLVGEVQIAHGLGDIDRQTMLIAAIDELAADASPAARVFAWRFCGYLTAASRMTGRARELLTKARDERDRHPSVGSRALIEASEAIGAWAEGRWDEALALIDSARPDLEHCGEWIQVAHLAAAEVRIHIARGAYQRAAQVTLPQVALPPPYHAIWVEAQAALTANTGALEAAISLLEHELRGLRENTMVSVGLTSTLGRLLGRAGDLTSAERTLDIADQMTATCRSPAARLHVSLSKAEVLSAERFALEAVSIADLLGCPFEKGRGLLALGRATANPLEPLTAAWHIFRRLHAEPWRYSTAAALREAGLPVPRLRRRDPEELTDAERQVAELVRAGMRNREIADRLSYSPRTVESYLTRIYRKLGVDSRLALARALDEPGRH